MVSNDRIKGAAVDGTSIVYAIKGAANDGTGVADDGIKRTARNCTVVGNGGIAYKLAAGDAAVFSMTPFTEVFPLISAAGLLVDAAAFFTQPVKLPPEIVAPALLNTVELSLNVPAEMVPSLFTRCENSAVPEMVAPALLATAELNVPPEMVAPALLVTVESNVPPEMVPWFSISSMNVLSRPAMVPLLVMDEFRKQLSNVIVQSGLMVNAPPDMVAELPVIVILFERVKCASPKSNEEPFKRSSSKPRLLREPFNPSSVSTITVIFACAEDDQHSPIHRSRIRTASRFFMVFLPF